MDDYLKDPHEIERRSFVQIRELTDLTPFDDDAKQVVMRLVHTCGNPAVAKDVRFSPNAIAAGVNALHQRCTVLCDVEMVRNGLTRRYLNSEPLCFLNDEAVPDLAKTNDETRTMSALSLWQPQLKNSIAIIGNAPTALYRLMEMLEAGADKPALVIGIPVGFIGAAESKQYLWDNAESLGIECITVLGRTGGSALAAGCFNTLVRLQRGLRF